MNSAMRMLILLLAISLGPNSAIVAGVKPNIVLILGDDMGIDAVRAFNDKRLPAVVRKRIQQARLRP